MGNKGYRYKFSVSPYGIFEFSLIFIAEIAVFIFGIYSFVDNENILICSFFNLFFVSVLIYLYRAKYLCFITITDIDVSTKKRRLSWGEVYITLTNYYFHLGTKGETYFLFFDDHYLSEHEILTPKVKKGAFYMLATAQRLDVVIKKYNKPVQVLTRCELDHKDVYEKVCKFNDSVRKN